MPVAAPGATIVAFGAALVPILFTYGGWQSVNYVGEEIVNPKRNLPVALIAGTIAVVVIYLTVNVVFLRAMGLPGLAATQTPAADAARRMFGAWGDVFMSSAIAISTFGFLDLSILAPTRVYYAMAADRLFVPALATLHPRYATPSLAILVQSTWSCILALTGSYEQLANYVVFADWIFFGLTVADRADLPPQGAAHGAAARTPSGRRAIRSSRSCSSSSLPPSSPAPSARPQAARPREPCCWPSACRCITGTRLEPDDEIPRALHGMGEDAAGAGVRSRRQQHPRLLARRSAGRA